jgi:hypothetical protein
MTHVNLVASGVNVEPTNADTDGGQDGFRVLTARVGARLSGITSACTVFSRKRRRHPIVLQPQLERVVGQVSRSLRVAPEAARRPHRVAAYNKPYGSLTDAVSLRKNEPKRPASDLQLACRRQ